MLIVRLAPFRLAAHLLVLKAACARNEDRLLACALEPVEPGDCGLWGTGDRGSPHCRDGRFQRWDMLKIEADERANEICLDSIGFLYVVLLVSTLMGPDKNVDFSHLTAYEEGISEMANRHR